MKAVPRRLLVLGGGPVGVEMAQAVRRLGGEVALVEGADHVLAREPAPLGEALGEVLRRDGVELALGVHATAARRDGEDYVLVLDDGRELRGDRLLVATGRRPRVDGIGLETVGVEADAARHPGRRAPARRRAAVGDRRRHRHLAAHPRRQVPGRGRRREHPRRAARGQLRGRAAAWSTPTRRRPRSAPPRPRFSATVPVSEVAKTATYTRAYAESNGFLTLLSDGERLTGAYALGPEAGEWLQQATLAIRARVPLDVLRDTIQPFPTFSEIYVGALKALHGRIAAAARRRAVTGEALAGQTGAGDRRQLRASGWRRPGSPGRRAPRSCSPAATRSGCDARRPRSARSAPPPSTPPTSAALERFFAELPAPIDHVMVTAGGPYYAPLADMDFARARRDIDEHLWLPLHVARDAAGRVRPGGTLLFMSGTGGRRTAVGLSLVSTITAALPALTTNLALEIAPIRVNLIAPGFVDTPLSASLLGDDLDQRREQLRATLPIGRVVGPADVAALAVHLMTNTALTGATYDIDGGQQLVPG